MNRETILAKLRCTPSWDVVVVGGGASGLGIALDAVTRGYTTLLLEQSDFAKSTSSKSTKLIHGGVRYLAQGNIGLVREATLERGRLARNAAHLVKNQSFIIPTYNWWDKVKYTLGLKLYDWMSGRLSLGPSVFISRQEVMEKLPGIISRKLAGGVRYHDGQFDDARLALNLAQTIMDSGGYALNYMKVTGLQKDGGKVVGINAVELESQSPVTIRAKVVINATGVFVDDIVQMDQPGTSKNVVVSQGVHLVLEKDIFPGNDAMLIPETSDGRVLFIVPWHRKILMGTTDTPVGNISLEPVALESEIDFILSTAGRYLTVPPKRTDVVSVFAGLRPLAAPSGQDKRTKEVSRSHKILVSPSGLFSIIGGKWTTYRKMGEDMMDKVESEMQWAHTPTRTAAMPVHGSVSPLPEEGPLSFYGSDQPAVQQLITDDGGEWISQKLGLYKGQLTWAVRQEAARTVEDFLSRRTRSLLLDARESIRVSPLVARLMAAELHRDAAWITDQVQPTLDGRAR